MKPNLRRDLVITLIRKNAPIFINDFWSYKDLPAFRKFLVAVGFNPKKHFYAQFRYKKIKRERVMKYLGIKFKGNYHEFVGLFKRNPWLVKKIIREGFLEIAGGEI